MSQKVLAYSRSVASAKKPDLTTVGGQLVYTQNYEGRTLVDDDILDTYMHGVNRL
jgi:hypothetical protein